VTEGIILRSKCRRYEEGKKSTKYCSTLEKRNKAKTQVTEPSSILKIITEFYGELYSDRCNFSEEECS
jgi:hypothetical protein